MMKKGILVFLALGIFSLYGGDFVRLNELSSIGGKFIILNNSIYAFDSKEYLLKIFSLKGELINAKSIKGEGPGEVSTLGSMIFSKGENLLILDPIKKRWIEYDKKLNFLREGRFPEPVTTIKKMGKNLIGVNTGLEEGKYIRKIYLFSESFELEKEIYREYGKTFKDKMDTNEFYITIDTTDELIALGCGSQNTVRLIDINGELKKEISVNIKPARYDKDSLNLIKKFLPQKIENFLEFASYPFIYQILFISTHELLIISGETAQNNHLKSYIYNLNSQTTKNITLPMGIYCFHKDILYIISEDEEGYFLKEVRIK